MRTRPDRDGFQQRTLQSTRMNIHVEKEGERERETVSAKEEKNVENIDQDFLCI